MHLSTHHTDISIHVPREGDDIADTHKRIIDTLISIHVPREGDDAKNGKFDELLE